MLELGGSLKKTAMKATGCLVIVMCSPLLIFGVISGNWRAVLISVAIVVALVAIAFKLVERKVKSSVNQKLSGVRGESNEGPAAAGPLNSEVRRQSLDKLLMASGLPPLNKLEPYFPPKDEFGLPV